jgi:HPt (histidine-containing phosphotransfer) domain-containing protein
MELALRLAHTLKSVAGTIGAVQLAEVSRSTESAIKNEESTKFDGYLYQIEYWLDSTLKAISKFEQPNQSTQKRQN